LKALNHLASRITGISLSSIFELTCASRFVRFLSCCLCKLLQQPVRQRNWTRRRGQKENCEVSVPQLKYRNHSPSPAPASDSEFQTPDLDAQQRRVQFVQLPRFQGDCLLGAGRCKPKSLPCSWHGVSLLSKLQAASCCSPSRLGPQGSSFFSEDPVHSAPCGRQGRDLHVAPQQPCSAAHACRQAIDGIMRCLFVSSSSPLAGGDQSESQEAG